jgi:hypothetical protein
MGRICNTHVEHEIYVNFGKRPISRRKCKREENVKAPLSEIMYESVQ